MKLTTTSLYKSTTKVSMALLLLSIYSVLLYFILTNQTKLDFSSLFSALQALAKGNNPYQKLFTTYLPTVTALPLSLNLNPPFVLWLFSPLAQIHYNHAVAIWSALSFILGLTGTSMAFSYAFSPAFLKKHWAYLYLIYFSCFATILNMLIAQLGALLLFLIMSGYRLYIKKHDYAAGIVWGVMISMKLFPALLFFYALIQKRYRVSITMLFVFILMWLLPWFVYGTTIYTQYMSMMSRVFWYGDNWNASIYGMIVRLFGNQNLQNQSWLFIHLLYGSIFCIFFIFYLRKMMHIEKMRIEHRSFCLTIVMMLLLSPLGWLYYFPLLTLPLALTWLTAINTIKQSITTISAWFLCLFCINLPVNYVPTSKMPSLIGKLGIYSFYFYGLLLLLYLTNKIKIYNSKTIQDSVTTNQFTPIFFIIFSLGLFLVIKTYAIQLFI